MNAGTKLALTIAGLAIAIPQGAALAKAPNAKLLSGSWELNTGKSKFSSPDYTPKSDKRTYSVTGKRVKMRSHMTNAQGKTVTWGYSAVANGRWYPTYGNTGTDHIALTVVNDREIKSQTRLKGKMSSKATVDVSADGKELTIHRSLLTAKGGATDDTMVFDRTK